MRPAVNTAALGLAGLGLGLVASALPAAAASGARLELTKAHFALLLAAGLWTRALASGFSGAVVDRFGGRKALICASTGAAAAAAAVALLFLGGRERAMFVGVAILHAAACYFLTFAGPAAARINVASVDPAARGRHAGLYGALAFPAEFLALPAGLWLSARLPASMLLFAPSAAALLAVAAAFRAPSIAREDGPRPGLAGLRALLLRRSMLVLATLEACAGVVRWGLIGWSAQFLSEVHNIRAGGPSFGASLIAVAAGAALGPLACGFASDNIFGGRRAPALTAIFAIQAVALAAFGRAQDPGLAVAFLALACASVFGAHALLSGAAAMDAGGPRSAGLVSGLFAGVHHLAGGLSVLLVGALIDRDGWGAWTRSLIPFSLAGAAAALLLASLKPEAPDPSL